IKGKMICVLGCGGDRDRTKRPLMGKASAQLADVSVVTSDYPRTEDPNIIIDEMEAGVPAEFYNRTISITDRKQAIKTACQMASANDIILIAGKGHETYQEINGERFDFDDYKTVQEFLKQLQK
ncbi:MAG: UDP-N-acetylmuramoyl-L-alanyl-D-glutamate--2,6-diaminopimelate ligase, partial [Winogradskyella sp.]|uniref:glutamate ligase domain-containing protein n=1 Tax=Winogradskyella sp. TaxID=1883156 RepID=UPI0025FD8F54